MSSRTIQKRRKMQKQVFPIVPSKKYTSWTLVIIILIMLTICGIFGYITYSIKNCTFEISSRGLRIKGDLYGRLIPSSSMIKEQARIVDTIEEWNFRPSVRTNGIFIPGYASGWYKLYNGERALVFVKNPKQVVYIPTKDGYSLLISPAEPEKFLDMLKKMK
jgi:hypothetical protein